MAKLNDTTIDGILSLINNQDECEDVLKTLKELNTNMQLVLNKLLFPVVFSSAESETITFQAPFDCWVHVTMSFLGWGYAGALYTWEIKSDDSGIICLGQHFAGCQGGDIENKEMIAKCIYSGLKKGNSYTFYKQNDIGSQGAFNNARISAICFPEFNNQDT